MTQQDVYYRPPSEEESFIVRVMRGCPHNACTFCNLFKDTPCEVLPLQEVKEGLDRDAADLGPDLGRMVTSMYLEGGDPIAIRTEHLLAVMEYAKLCFPALTRFACYATARFTVKKTQEELNALAAAGLHRVFVGLESGSDMLLHNLHKGCTASDIAKAGHMLKTAGIELDVSLMLGVGGPEFSREHAVCTAELLNATCPECVRIRTYAAKTNTELGEDYLAGRFRLMGPHAVLQELRLMVEGISGTMQLLSEHWTNFIHFSADMPDAKHNLLHFIDQHLQRPESDFRTIGITEKKS